MGESIPDPGLIPRSRHESRVRGHGSRVTGHRSRVTGSHFVPPIDPTKTKIKNAICFLLVGESKIKNENEFFLFFNVCRTDWRDHSLQEIISRMYLISITGDISRMGSFADAP